MEQASVAEKRAALPQLLRWAADPRPTVRLSSLTHIYFSLRAFTFAPSSGPNGLRPDEIALTPEQMSRIASHLLDPDDRVSYVTTFSLRTLMSTPAGRRELQPFLLSVLRGSQALQSSAPGVMAFYLLLNGNPNQVAIEPALLSFLNRDDQTGATLKECLHNVGLAGAPEPVANDAINRVFEKGAMSDFLIQFLGRVTLTPEHLMKQRARLAELAQDSSATAETRHAAAVYAKCWGQDEACWHDPSNAALGGASQGSSR
ncbi:hypothetical protein [Terriglobus aquaticus]|uniref:Uncharacterized protein n=1 Tax=Terriglobus aquaticus TaxID=940139 RepID=A0ABW9KJR3_9BACT|nr:hypothetical protein [Terriglobus aquaticus]